MAHYSATVQLDGPDGEVVEATVLDVEQGVGDILTSLRSIGVQIWHKDGTVTWIPSARIWQAEVKPVKDK